MDFPDNWIPPINISTTTRYCGEPTGFANGITSTVGSVTSISSNQTVYIPITLPGPFPVASFFWVNGPTVSGSITMCVRTVPTSAAIVSQIIVQTATTTQVGASSIQIVSPSSSNVLLPAGSYLLGIATSTSANSFIGRAISGQTAARLGFMQSATVLGTPDSAQQIQGVPICGISRWDSTSAKQIW